MRPDMGKVITERPRQGMRIKQRKGEKKAQSKIAPEDQPKSEKIRQKWISGHEDGKRFTDVLGPLQGYVRKQIGRPFSKVFSEISKVLRPTGLSGSHAQGHLWQMLETKVVIDEKGRPCYSNIRYRSLRDSEDDKIPIYDDGGTIAYVDPRDDIIKAAPKRPTYPRKKELPKVIWDEKDEMVGYKQINEIWYALKFEPIKEEVHHEVRFIGKMKFYDTYTILKGYDVLLKEDSWTYHFGSRLQNAYGKTDRVAKNKKQLNSKEITKLGLKDKKTDPWPKEKAERWD